MECKASALRKDHWSDWRVAHLCWGKQLVQLVWRKDRGQSKNEGSCAMYECLWVSLQVLKTQNSSAKLSLSLYSWKSNLAHLASYKKCCKLDDLYVTETCFPHPGHWKSKSKSLADLVVKIHS